MVCRNPGRALSKRCFGTVRRRAPERTSRVSEDAGRRFFSRSDGGAVTAEFAVVLPAVIVVALLLLSLGRAVLVRVECQDAARAGAREIAVARSYDGAASGAARRAALSVSAKSSVELTESSSTVRVKVTCPVMPGPLGVLPLHVEGIAVAMKQASES